MQTAELTDAVRRAARLASDGAPRSGPPVLGITGPPGSGKSTLAAAVAAAVPGAVVVGMDGYHLAHAVLERRGQTDRKGAPHTFDAAGYLALLQRIRAIDPGEDPVWAPEFRREIEDAVAGAVEVPGEAALVVTEGNYLLLDQAPWAGVRGLLDACWYVTTSEEARRDRLRRRHESFGRSPDEALARTLGSDEANARLVAETRDRADLLVTC